MKRLVLLLFLVVTIGPSCKGDDEGTPAPQALTDAATGQDSVPANDVTTPPPLRQQDTVTTLDDTAVPVPDAGPVEEVTQPPVVELGPAGEWCTAGGVIDPSSLPASVEGDTTDGESHVEPSPCASSIGTAPDAVWSFTPDTTAYYNISLLSEGPTLVVITTDCDDIEAGCVDSGDFYSATEKEFLLDAGITYNLIVDGWSQSEIGPFTLGVALSCVPDCGTVECGGDGCGGECPSLCTSSEICEDTNQCGDVSFKEGATCSNPFQIKDLPFVVEGASTDGLYNTNSFGPDVCPDADVSQGAGGGSSDAVYSFSPEVSGVYTITVDADFDAAVYVVTNCDDVAASCKGAADEPETLVLSLETKQTYFIIVDGYSNTTDYAGTYTLSLSEPCLPDCGGKACGGNGCGGECNNVCGPGTVCNYEAGLCDDLTGIPGASCVNPLTVGALPFTGEGTTEGLANAYSFGADSCPGKSSGAGAGSSEAVWLFEPTSDGIYTLEVEPDFDATLYVVTDCGNMDGSCLGGSDSFGTETLILTLEAGTPYYVVVDGWSNSEEVAGTYVLSISEPCVPSCEGKACGSDGCGGECPNGCTEVQTCAFETNECVDLTGGDTCDAATAIDVTTLPAFVIGDNTGTADDYDSGLCMGTGSEGKDIVYSITLEQTQALRVTLESDGPTLGYVASDCAALEACVGGKDFWQGGHLDVTLEGPGTYYVVVDGWSASEEGGFTLIVDEVPPSYSFMINEVDPNQVGKDTNEFIELYNGTEDTISLAPYSVRHINGSNGEKLTEWFLADAGPELLPGQFMVIGSANVMLSVPEGTLTLTMDGTSDLLQNGADGVTLLNYEVGAIEDSIAWEGPVEGAGEPLGEGHTYDDNPTESLSRCPAFVDSDVNYEDFDLVPPTPGAPNACDQ